MKSYTPTHRFPGDGKNQKTYSHLAGQRRVPSEYELVTSELLYYPARGFELNVPVSEFYERNQRRSALRCADWDGFRDPRETTYTKYTGLARNKEIYVDGILQSIEDSGYDAKLGEAWRTTLECFISPARFLFHGLQMLAANVGQLAPGGRLVIATLFQAADEMRRVHRFAYRLRQLQLTYAEFGADGKQRWQQEPRWQPCREVIERLLVTYDFGESLVALNLVVKPLLDELLMTQLGKQALACGDPLLRELLHSLDEDCEWQRSYTAVLFTHLLADPQGAQNRVAINGWISKWLPLAEKAISGLAALMQQDGTEIVAGVLTRHRAFLGRCGLPPESQAVADKEQP